MNALIAKMFALRRGALAVLLAWCVPNSGAAADLNLAEHAGLAGGQVVVPVMLQNGSGLSALQLSVNFDPQILSFVSATNGNLGAFDLVWNVSDGTVRIVGVRANGIAGANGNIVLLTFTVNPGAVAGLRSPLVVSTVSASSENARDLAWLVATTHTDGAVRVVNLATDTDGNGLPDWWEEKNFGAPIGAEPNADSDGDGMSNIAEFFAGTNPNDASDVLRLNPHVSNSMLQFSFNSVSGKHYQVQFSQDLQSWSDFGGVKNGDGTPLVVTDSIQNTSGFYRIIVVP